MIAKFIKKVVLLTVIVVFNGTSILSQTVTQKFYKDSYLYKEVEESKAKFSLKLYFYPHPPDQEDITVLASYLILLYQNTFFP
jgi:hypothetical protein